jgi:hypothetical protein
MVWNTRPQDGQEGSSPVRRSPQAGHTSKLSYSIALHVVAWAPCSSAARLATWPSGGSSGVSVNPHDSQHAASGATSAPQAGQRSSPPSAPSGSEEATAARDSPHLAQNFAVGEAMMLEHPGQTPDGRSGEELAFDCIRIHSPDRHAPGAPRAAPVSVAPQLWHMAQPMALTRPQREQRYGALTPISGYLPQRRA